MKRVSLRTPLVALGLVVALNAFPVGVHAAMWQRTDAAPVLHDDVRALLDARLAAGPPGPPDALHDACVARHGALAPLFAALDAAVLPPEAEAPDEAARERSYEARRVRAWLRWRDGQLPGALEDFERLAAQDPAGLGGEAALARARLLDASGRAEDALEAYAALADARAGGPDEGWLRLRVALMEMELGGDDGKGALSAYARGDGVDPALRNRAAVVLALLGRPADAIELYVPADAGKERARDLLRVAEWALRAEDPGGAQAAAWGAVRASTLGRERRYALGVLLEAHRADGSEAALVERFAALDAPTPEERETWIALLRETDRFDEAIELFAAGADGFSPEERRELLEMYRQAGAVDAMLDAYHAQIVAQPRVLAWREGLARFHLERGEPDEARAVWTDWLERDGFADADGVGALVEGAYVLSELGLDDLARAAGERAAGRPDGAEEALLFLFGLERDRGRLDAAAELLERLDRVAAPDAPVRYQLSEGFEQLGDPARAADALEAVVAARGAEEAGEDVAMRLAWLYSELGDEDRALAAWSELAERVRSIPRRRYCEDRLMTVAARLGRLADLAIDLETKLQAGRALEREANLLVRLYTKVNDAVSAAEVIEEFLRESGRGEVEALQEKARVYLTCTDYYHYERTVRRLIELDPEGEGDYLRQIAMSQLERGKPDEARRTLERLGALETDAAGAEFEAGVLTLAGMRVEAVAAYRRGLAEHPERIDGYLLMAQLLGELGEADRAVGTFQYLAETADQDDLFTIAIDGLLNMLVDAPPRPAMLAWARRVTLERLARRADEPYLYQLLADLAEEAGDSGAQLDALEYSLASAGTRRGAILREAMDLAKAGGDQERQLAYGRRLVGLGELVPPDVYLDLGEAFLGGDDVASAVKTFGLARDLPDPVQFRRETAALLERSGYAEEARDTYAKVLSTRPSDAGLIVKVAELEESLGRDADAHALYAKVLELLLARRPLLETDEEEETDAARPAYAYFSRNLDDYERFHRRASVGWLATVADEAAGARALVAWRERFADELVLARARVGDGEPPRTLAQHPRLAARATLHRDLALGLRDLAGADALDRRLLAAFPEDEGLLETMVLRRVRFGFSSAAGALVAAAEVPDDVRTRLRARAGLAAAEGAPAPGRVTLAEGVRRVLPLAAAGEAEALALLVRQVDLAGLDVRELGELAALFSAARWTGDPDLVLYVTREWVRLALVAGQSRYQLEQTLANAGAALDEARRRSLYQYFVSLVLEDPGRGSQFVPLLPVLAEEAGGGLLGEEQVLELLDEYGERYAYGLGPVFTLLPEEQRAGALRSLWPKLENTRRTSFLVELVVDTAAPLGDGLGAFVREAFPEAYADGGDLMSYYVPRLAETQANHALALALVEDLRALEADPLLLDALGAALLAQLDRDDEALAAYARTWVATTGEASVPYQVRNALRSVEQQFRPDRGEALFAAVLAAVEAVPGWPVGVLDGGRDAGGEAVAGALPLEPERERALLHGLHTLARSAQLDDERARIVEVLLARHADELSTWSTAQVFYDQSGRPLDAIRAAEEIDARLRREAEEDADGDEEAGLSAARQRLEALLGRWRSLEHWPAALRVAERIEAMGEDGLPDPAEAAAIPGFPPGFVIPAGAIYVVNGVVYRGGEAPGKGLPRTIADVKEALDDDRVDDARLVLRRLWREFQLGETSDPYRVFAWSRSPLAALAWPAEPAPEGEQEEPDEERRARDELRRRGGLDGLVEEPPAEPVELPSAYDRLTAHASLEAELRRFLRTREPSELATLQGLYGGFVTARVEVLGEAGALEELLGELEAGTGGRVAAAMLLTLLDRAPALLDERVEAHLATLVQGVDPKDAVQVLRLARVWARAGRTADALRLYRWVATRLSGSRYGYFGFAEDDGTTVVDAFQLVQEAREVLEGDECVALVEDVLRFAQAPDDPWSRGRFERMVIDTWLELLPPAEALERARPVAEAVLDLSTGLRRDVALRAAVLFAGGGATAQAVEALEVALCRLDPALVTQPEQRWYRSRPEQPGGLSNTDLSDLFPSEPADWQQPADWYEAVAEAATDWHRAHRLAPGVGERLRAVAAARLGASGRGDRAQALVRELLDDVGAATTDEDAGLLFVADAARRTGDHPAAVALERRLFERGALPLVRLPELIGALAAEDPAAALALATEASDRHRGEALLRAARDVAAAATAAGAAQASADVAHWQALLDEALAAEAALEAFDERMEALREERVRRAEEAEAGDGEG